SASPSIAGERRVQARDELRGEEVELLRPHSRPAGDRHEPVPLGDRLRLGGDRCADRVGPARLDLGERGGGREPRGDLGQRKSEAPGRGTPHARASLRSSGGGAPRPAGGCCTAVPAATAITATSAASTPGTWEASVVVTSDCPSEPT